MENELKDIVKTAGIENLFNTITADCTVLAKYKFLIPYEDTRKYYLQDVNNLYTSLIRKCRLYLADYYRKEIENIFTEDIESLPKTNENLFTKHIESLPKTNEKTVKTVKVEKTWRPAGQEAGKNEKTEETEEETDEES